MAPAYVLSDGGSGQRPPGEKRIRLGKVDRYTVAPLQRAYPKPSTQPERGLPMGKRPNRAMRRRMRQYLATKGIEYKAETPKIARPELRRSSSVKSLHNLDYVMGLAQKLANITGRPQAVVRDNGNKCFVIAESAARNAKPSNVPAKKRRNGGLVRSKNPYFPTSRLGGRVLWPKTAE